MVVALGALIDRAELAQQRGETLAVLGPRRRKENSSARKANAIYASSKGTNFMIVPTERGPILQPARVLMLEKGTKGMILHARRLDPV